MEQQQISLGAVHIGNSQMDALEKNSVGTSACVNAPVHEPSVSEERNLFLELEKMMNCGLPQTNGAAHCAVSKSISGVTLDSPIYMDNSIQPSPKDSGVDMSSPERKIDDICEASSQDSSPRVYNSHSDANKVCPPSLPKYAAIGNFGSTSANLYSAGSEGHTRCSNSGVDQNMNCSVSAGNVHCSSEMCSTMKPKSNSFHQVGSHYSDSENDSGQEVMYIGEGESSDGLLEPGDVIVHSLRRKANSDHGDMKHSTTPTCPPDLEREDFPVIYNEPNDTPCQQAADPQQNCSYAYNNLESDMDMENDCTLAELNLSQKSTETDIQSITSKSMPSTPRVTQDTLDSSYNYPSSSCLDEQQLFSSLNEGSSCPFSLTTPNKNNSFSLLPSPRKKSSLITTPTVSTPSKVSLKNIASASGFLSEFTKFLQSSAASVEQEEDPPSPVHVKNEPKLSGQKKIKRLSLKKSHDKTNYKHTCREPIDIESSAVSSVVLPTTEPIEEARVIRDRTKCMCCCVPRRTNRPASVNVKRFVKGQKKVLALKRCILKFLKTIFPDLDISVHMKRTLNSVDLLLDQVLNCVEERKKPKHLQVIPVETGILDVRIVVCMSPLTCIRHLRRKVCHLLQVILPDLSLSWPFNTTGDEVDNLLREIIFANSS